MTDEETVGVWYYDHECEWLTKYCDEFHRVYVRVPLSVLKEYS